MTNLKKTTLQFLILFLVCQNCKSPTPIFNARYNELKEGRGRYVKKHFAIEEVHALYVLWTVIVGGGVPEGVVKPYEAYCALRRLGVVEKELTGKSPRHDKLADSYKEFFVLPFDGSKFQIAFKEHGGGDAFKAEVTC